MWAYIGPRPAPELPRFDVYVMDGVRDIGWCDLPCSWLQIMENAVDPHHVEWLHGRYFNFIGRHEGFESPPSFAKKHQQIGFTEFEWGIIKRRVLEGASEENDDWKIGHPLVFPYNCGSRVRHRADADPGADRRHPHPVHAVLDARAGRWIPGPAADPRLPDPVDGLQRPAHCQNYVEGQDIMTWVTQGAIPDRTTEHLGRSDIGVTMLRRMFRSRWDRRGRRGPARRVSASRDRIDLPCERDKFHAGALRASTSCRPGSSRYSPQLDALRSCTSRPTRQEGRGRVTVALARSLA